MKKLVLSIFLLLVLSANTAFAKSNIYQNVYKGKIGNQNVVFEIIEAKENSITRKITARYFYEKHRTLIQTIASLNGTKLLLKESKEDCVYNENDCEIRAAISLQYIGKKLVGKWVGKNNKTYLVELSLISSRTFANNNEPKTIFELQNYSNNDFSMNKFLELQLNPSNKIGVKTQIGSTSYAQVTDIYTGVNYPYLISFKNEKVLKKIQNLMKINRMQMVSYALECKGQVQSMGSASGTFGSWDEYQSKIIFVDENLLVIEESGSTYCGGAHPNNTLSHTIYDLVKGEVFNANNYFYLYENFKSEYEFDKTKKYQDFLTKLDENSKYFIGVKEEEFYKDCIEGGLSHELSIHFDNKNVIFSLENLPHVIGACMGDYFKVPYKDIMPLMRPEGKKFFAKYIMDKAN